MHNFIPKDIADYVAQHSSPPEASLQHVHRQTFLKTIMPHMISGHDQGVFLSMISAMVRPNRVLEIGTFTGYSALCLASGLRPDGKLHTIDSNAELRHMQLDFFRNSPYADQIELHTGKALDIIPQIRGPFDLVFIDADKVNYLNYYTLMIDQMTEGGIILADNVLWYGNVTQGETDKKTSALDQFNKTVTSDERVQNVLLPIGDGIMMIRKL